MFQEFEILSYLGTNASESVPADYSRNLKRIIGVLRIPGKSRILGGCRTGILGQFSPF
jgi:hypothetical protein